MESQEKDGQFKVKDALQNLTTGGTFQLFAEDSEVFESGGVEDSYANYIEHNLGSKLGRFKKFKKIRSTLGRRIVVSTLIGSCGSFCFCMDKN
jgi:hypothetical protein